MNKQQKILLTSIVIFLIAGLILAIYLAQQIAKPTPKAVEENNVVFTFQPVQDLDQLNPNDRLDVELEVAPPTNAAITILTLRLEFDASRLELITHPVDTDGETVNTAVEQTTNSDSPVSNWSFTQNTAVNNTIYVVTGDMTPNNANALIGGSEPVHFGTVSFTLTEPLPNLDENQVTLLSARVDSFANESADNIAIQATPLTYPPAQTEEPTATPTPGIGQGALYFDPSSADYQSGQTFDTNVLFDTDGEDVTSVDALIRYDPRIVTFVSARPGTAFPQNFTPEERGAGLVYVGGAVENPRQPVRGNRLLLATITWQAKSEISLPERDDAAAPPFVTTEISFDCTPGSTSDSNITRADVDATDILACSKIINGTYTIEFPQFTDQPSLYLSPSSGKVPAGGMFTATVFLSTGGNDVSGVDAVLTFDPQILKVVSTAKGNIPAFIAYFENIDNDNGKVTVSALISPDVTEVEETTAGSQPRPNQTPVNGQGLKLATVTFKALPIRSPAPTSSPVLAEVQTPVDFDFTPKNKNDSNIAEYHKGGDILAATFGATYTVSFEPVSGTSLKLKLELCDEPSRRNVVIRLPDDTQLETNLSGKNEGKVHTTDPVNIPQGTRYLAVRAYGYLEHTFRLPASWADLIDLSSFTLLGGDIDGFGKVNVLDFNLFKSAYLRSEVAPDLDCSGQVNTLDYDGIVRNWNKTSD